MGTNRNLFRRTVIQNETRESQQWGVLDFEKNIRGIPSSRNPNQNSAALLTVFFIK
jgi:hypothetical protein